MKIIIIVIILTFNANLNATIIDSMRISIAFRGDFKAFEKYELWIKTDSMGIEKLLTVNGHRGYSYYYFSGFEQVLENEALDSLFKILQIRMFSGVEIAFRIPKNDSGKNILYFDKVRSTKTRVPFDIKWIDKAELNNIMWLDYCAAKHFLNRKRIKVNCISL